MNIVEQIRVKIIEILALYEEHKDYYNSNETATRDHLINPMLNVLNWQTSSPKYVLPNQKNEIGDIPDYTLLKNGKKILVAEAKKASVEIRDAKVIAQLTKYSYNMGIRFGIVTNGLKWLLFNTFQQDPSERIVWVIDLLRTEDNYNTEIKRLLTIAYNEVELLENSINRIKLLEKFWSENLNSSEEIVRFISFQIREKTKRELTMDLQDIEDFVEAKLNIGSKNDTATQTPVIIVGNDTKNDKPKSGKASQTILKVIFQDGTVIFNKRASDTLKEVIEKIGGERVKTLGLLQNGVALVGTQKSDAYQQYQISGGLYVMVHSSTKDKMKNLNIISQKLNLNLKIEIIEG